MFWYFTYSGPPESLRKYYIICVRKVCCILVWKWCYYQLLRCASFSCSHFVSPRDPDCPYGHDSPAVLVHPPTITFVACYDDYDVLYLGCLHYFFHDFFLRCPMSFDHLPVVFSLLWHQLCPLLCLISHHSHYFGVRRSLMLYVTTRGPFWGNFIIVMMITLPALSRDMSWPVLLCWRSFPWQLFLCCCTETSPRLPFPCSVSSSSTPAPLEKWQVQKTGKLRKWGIVWYCIWFYNCHLSWHWCENLKKTTRLRCRK